MGNAGGPPHGIYMRANSGTIWYQNFYQTRRLTTTAAGPYGTEATASGSGVGYLIGVCEFDYGSGVSSGEGNVASQAVLAAMTGRGSRTCFSTFSYSPSSNDGATMRGLSNGEWEDTTSNITSLTFMFDGQSFIGEVIVEPLHN